jgi:hypothetical protein
MGRLRLKTPPAGRPKRRRPRLTRLTRSRIGTWTGGGLIATGTGLGWGLPVALIVAGVLLAAYCLLVADVADPGADDGRPRTW